MEQKLGRTAGELWENSGESAAAITEAVNEFSFPQTMMVKIRLSAERILKQLPELLKQNPSTREAQRQRRSYPHARELMLIYLTVQGKDFKAAADFWPKNGRPSRRGSSKSEPKPRRRR